MKTHKKVGVTLLMKLLVGINGDKNFLAHYRVGPPSKKGDEFPDTKFKNVAFTRKVLRFISDKLLTKRNKFSDVLWLIARGVGKPFLTFLQEAGLIKKPEISDQIMNGNWYGNDTAWRMAIDLARIALFTDKEGIVTVSPQRNVFAIVDGIIAGEGDGPMSSEPLQAGILVAGENILAVDSVTTTVMGFDWKKIRMIKNAWELATHRLAEFPIDAITIHSNDSALDGKNASNCRKFCFRPHRHWIGTIELE